MESGPRNQPKAVERWFESSRGHHKEKPRNLLLGFFVSSALNELEPLISLIALLYWCWCILITLLERWLLGSNS